MVQVNRCRKIYGKLTVVVPTLNEARAIGKVIDELLETGIPRENILVVDGGSRDRTPDIAVSKGVRVVSQVGRGKAMAVKTALKYINTPYVVFMDGDYTYPSRYICQLLSKLEEGYEYVIGARKCEKGSQHLFYRLGNALLTRFFNFLFGTSLSDVLSGMYACRTERLKEVNFEMQHFSVESEILAHMASTIGKIAELPIHYRKRVGNKKLRISHGLAIARDMVRLTWRYYPTVFIFLLGALLLVPGLILGAYVAYHYFFTGIKYYVKGMIAIILSLAGFQSLLLAILALYISRIAKRTNQKHEELKRLLSRKHKHRTKTN